MIEELLENEVIIKVSKNSFGLAVMKKVIKFTENFDTRKRIMDIISKHTPKLIQDPYGNYVLQESLDNWSETYSQSSENSTNCFFSIIFQSIIGKIGKLAIQKFSSNVIEKCLEKANSYYRTIFIREIINGDSLTVMKNSYGNYVFQKSLALSKGIDKFNIIDVIFRNFPTIHDQKIKMKWIKLLKKNLKQEDVLEAEEEQEELNLNEEELVNYSHRFKLINDEISRYDMFSNKLRRKGGKKKMGIKESTYTSAVKPGYNQYNQNYPPPVPPASSYSYYNSGQQIEGGQQYPIYYQVPHSIPQPPPPNYAGPINQPLHHQQPPQGYSPVPTGSETNTGMNFGGYYSQSSPGYNTQGGYPSGYNQK